VIAFQDVKVDRSVGLQNSEGHCSSPKAAGRTCRLLYLVGELGPGGLERQLCYLLRAMDRARYRPAVVVWNFSPNDFYVREIRDLGVPIYFFPSGISRVAKLRSFRRLVRQLDPEVIHSYNFYTNVAVWWASLGSRVVPVGSSRCDFLFDRRSTGMILGRLCGRWPAAQICNSLAAKESIEHCALFKPHRAYVVRNGLDLSRFSPQPWPNKVALLAVGTLSARKRWDRLIRVLSLLSAKRLRFELRHVGDGPLRGELEELARRLHVDSVVHFLGLRNDIPELLADSSFLVHTAEFEGCPNVVMEAMACGRAVIAMDAGDIRYLVEDGKTGFVVPCGDEATLVERLTDLITDPDLCRRMGIAGRAKAEREFRLDRMVSETLAAYQAAGFVDV
jgi:glycosyltransferase involved in cell wall biosynthesis